MRRETNARINISIDDVVNRYHYIVDKEVVRYKPVIVSICLSSIDVILNTGIEEFTEHVQTVTRLEIWNHIDSLELRLELNVDFEKNLVSVVPQVELLFSIISDKLNYNFDKYLATTQHATYTNDNSGDTEVTKEYLQLPELFKDRFTNFSYENTHGRAVIPSRQIADSICLKSDPHLEMWPSPFKPRVHVSYDNKLHLSQLTTFRLKLLNSESNKSAPCPIIVNYDNTGLLVCFEEYEKFMLAEETNTVPAPVSVSATNLSSLVYMYLPFVFVISTTFVNAGVASVFGTT